MKALRACLVGLALVVVSTNASAARYKAYNRIYFDANGTPIGQTATYCNGVHWKGGETGGRIVLLIETGCGFREHCPIDSDTCGLSYDDSISVTLGGNPAFTRTEACQIVDELPCISAAPDILFTYGWTPVQSR